MGSAGLHSISRRSRCQQQSALLASQVTTMAEAQQRSAAHGVLSTIASECLQAATAAALLHIYHPEAAATLRLNLQADLLHCCRACLRAVGS